MDEFNNNHKQSTTITEKIQQSEILNLVKNHTKNLRNFGTLQSSININNQLISPSNF